MVRKYRGKNILEIGNVLSRHIKLEHDILDKYETAKGVINEDIVDFKSEKKYDLIISPLLNMLDGMKSDHTKIPCAIDNMKNLISSGGGTITITVPSRYNPTLDKSIEGWDNTVLQAISSHTNFQRQ